MTPPGRLLIVEFGGRGANAGDDFSYHINIGCYGGRSDWMATFLASLAKDDLTLGMLRGLRNDLQPFLTWRQSVEQGPFIAKGLAGYDLIAHWQHMVISGRHPATFNRRLDALRRLCRWAHASGSLVTDAARDVRPMRTVRNQQPVGLTHVEVHA